MRTGECTVAIRGPTIALKMVRHQLMLGEYMGTNWFGAK